MAEYFERKDLEDFNNGKIGEHGKKLWDSFLKYYGPVFQEGTLTTREKNLIALAVAHAVSCPYCIEAYTNASLESGYTTEQMMEAVHVASAITGGAVLAHGIQMTKVAEELEI
ncbi:MAG: arsenosugar biosynthesis-associated peroxidase-like protein [Lagierella massiliensis]|nr:arsenosugar biosynthesis-associated peroxidase-like protein [Lagierella massiliensis]